MSNPQVDVTRASPRFIIFHDGRRRCLWLDIYFASAEEKRISYHSERAVHGLDGGDRVPASLPAHDALQQKIEVLRGKRDLGGRCDLSHLIRKILNSKLLSRR